MFDAAVERHGGKIAAVFDETSISYKELRTRVENLAAHLQHGCGGKPGERVLLDMQNGIDFVIARLRILRADAGVGAVHPMNIASELTHYLEDSDARVAITEQDLLPRFSGLSLDHVLHLEKNFESKKQPRPSTSSPDDLCMMPYTSGSTGKPKGCMHTHAT